MTLRQTGGEGLSIREARKSDLDQMAWIEKRSIPDGWSQRAFEEALDNPQAMLLVLTRGREKEQVLAYLACYYAADEGEIVTVACDPAERKKGFAAALMEECNRRAQELGLRQIFLEVRRSNGPAQSLYEKRGFERVGIRPRMYAHPTEDAILMKLELTS